MTSLEEETSKIVLLQKCGGVEDTSCEIPQVDARKGLYFSGVAANADYVWVFLCEDNHVGLVGVEVSLVEEESERKNVRVLG